MRKLTAFLLAAFIGAGVLSATGCISHEKEVVREDHHDWDHRDHHDWDHDHHDWDHDHHDDDHDHH